MNCGTLQRTLWRKKGQKEMLSFNNQLPLSTRREHRDILRGIVCLILRLSKTTSCAFVPEGGKLRKSIVFDFVQTIVSLIDSVLLSLVKVKSILRFQWDGATVTFQRASSLLLAKTSLCVALRQPVEANMCFFLANKERQENDVFNTFSSACCRCVLFLTCFRSQ